MAHFYAEAFGRAQTACHRLGDKISGAEVHIRGWDAGVRVVAYVDERNHGEDTFSVFLTGGSNDPNTETYILSLAVSDIKEQVR